MSRRTRAAVRDRTWARFRTANALAPLAVPDAEQLRRTLHRLADHDPGHPLLGRLEGHGWRAVPRAGLDAHLDRVLEVTDEEDPVAVVDRLQAEAPHDLPVRVVLGRHLVATSVAHLVGDGATKNRWLRGLVLDDVALLARTGAARAPLARALARYARDPRRPLAGGRRAWPPGPARQELAPPDASGGTTGGPAAGLLGPPTTVGRLLPHEEVDRWRAFRDARQPEVSVATLLMSAVAARLAAEGLVGRGAKVMADCRRHLPDGAVVHGNFATGPWLDVDPADPVALGAALRASVADGVPLLVLGAATVRNVLRRPEGLPTAAGRDRPVPALVARRLTLSHQGRTGFDELPWLDRERARWPVAAEPDGPGGLTAAFMAGPSGLEVDVSFHASVTDPERVRRALQALSAPASQVAATG